ncbi:MAG: Tat pathway signal protein [Lewinella sp.]|nr:Tat pathway signal protein [Lewinella sp.]
MLSLGSCSPPPADHTAAGELAASEPVPFSLDELQERTFHYFWDLALPGHFQVPDRWPKETFTSIAATGFGLTAYIVGVERGYVTREAAAERTAATLRALWAFPQGEAAAGVSGYRGLFYHFLTYDAASVRFKDVELSTIDTGLLMAGVLSAQSYYDGDTEVEREIRELADALYRRVEWDWMLNDDGRISMGYRPERGFIEADWHGYNEAMVLLVLAMGSPTHPIPDNSWDLWCATYDWDTFYGYEHLNFDPLFGHQYSQMYIDFRGIQDAFMAGKGSDYFENSRQATLANRAYCIDNPHQFAGYGEHCWGLTACDGPANTEATWKGKPVKFFTYRARGAASTQIVDDGTIAPTAAGGSFPFAPEECEAALAHMWTTYYDQLVGEYGFRDAFNMTYPACDDCEGGWFDDDYLGIDQGPILIQIENHRSGLIWDVMKRNPYIRRGLERAGFKGGWLEETSEKSI